tara:strand:+ start:750 stop:995 length:246 start_codon:yes stop_codon:yes gene_type:complete
MDMILNELGKLNIAQLNELADQINQWKVIKCRTNLVKGMEVWVVQKTKRTPGVITKVNKTRCIVDMGGQEYNVPMSMLEPK